MAQVKPRRTVEQHAEYEKCASDICYFVNTYGFTYDPRKLDTNPILPFHLFPRQEEFLVWLGAREAAQESGLAEKSRDVGFTWLCCAYAVHSWLFRRGFSAGFGSRKLELVDRKGDPKTIFEKIRFLIGHLPEWMLPAGWNPVHHSGYCKVLNPENGASITGEGGDQIGRGGRTSIYFIDEAAFLAHPKMAEAALSATSNVKIWVSTPNGAGNSFYEKRFGGKVQIFTFHWRDDPRKDDVWYAKQRDELGDVLLAQEVDIDYTASVEGICIPAKWVRAAVGLFDTSAFRLAYPDYVPSGRVVAGLDVSAGGKNRTVFQARKGPYVFEPITWSENGTATAHQAADLTEAIGASVLHYDAVGVGYAVSSAFEAMERKLLFSPNAVIGGAAPTETRWNNGKSSKEFLLNRRAEIYWKLRARFEKAFEFLEEGVRHRPEDMIHLPNHPGLIAELSLALCFRMESGKWRIESKEEMSKRGISSPDFADALAYTEEGEGWLALEEDEALAPLVKQVQAQESAYDTSVSESAHVRW